MQEDPPRPVGRFDRRFFEGVETFTLLGSGELGGKASGLRRARDILDRRPDSLRFERLEISVPTLTVIGTGVFDQFVERNRLADRLTPGLPDHHVLRTVLAAELPNEISGDLWDLVRHVRQPLAVRSSSLLEDALEHPFAGVYATKMTPNLAHDAETRFRRLAEAIKFVWASTFFAGARAAARAAGTGREEKMAVIVQEVVGRRHRDRFYPDVAGVARSFNFYPVGDARPEEGVVDLALGLGKTIVDGGRTWTYCPASPQRSAPFASLDHMLDETQKTFWAVNMGSAPAYDPVNEAEYLVQGALSDADADGTLARIASTYDPDSDRMIVGTGSAGPRVLDFAPLLRMDEWGFNDAVRGLLDRFGEQAGGEVEIEFALTFPDEDGRPARLGFLQVRPMALSADVVVVEEALLAAPEAVVRSSRVMGNGDVRGIEDIVFVRRDRFETRHTPAIAAEIDRMNRELSEAGRPYILIGFGRWGSSDPWLGVPVAWPQISGVRAIVEATLPGMGIDMSQGAHFFHNLLGSGVAYFSVPSHGGAGIDWDWLESLPRRAEGDWVCSAVHSGGLRILVDGRAGRGVILRGEVANAG